MDKQSDYDLKGFIKEDESLWDKAEQKIKSVWQRAWKRQETIRLFSALIFNAVTTTKSSVIISSAAFSDFLLLINLGVTLVPTDITLAVEFSADGVNFHQLMNGPFGSLMYEDSAGAKKECVHGKILAPYMRVTATATGTSATALFTLTLDVVLNG
jgi:hypothetical protein